MLELNGKSREIVEKFSAFGLCEYEAKTYFALQVLGKTIARNLWRSSGIPQNKVYHAIQCLELKGLAEVSVERPKQIEAKPFFRFANDYLVEKKCALREIDAIIEQYRGEVRKNSKFVRVVV